MRWKKRKPYKDGDNRFIKRFAWLPKLHVNIYVWLEFYGVQQRYCEKTKKFITIDTFSMKTGFLLDNYIDNMNNLRDNT